MGPIKRAGQEFIPELSDRISASNEDPRETFFFKDYPSLYSDSMLYTSLTLLSTRQTPTTI
jgi:hypothetical protein